MDTTVNGIWSLVVAELRAAGYMESTIGQYEKTVKALASFAGDSGSSYTVPLGAASATMTAGVSPSTDTVSTIARRLGYRSEATFSRAYKRSFGVSPGGDRHPVTEEPLLATLIDA